MTETLPSAPRVALTPTICLQPPLSRRGTGPGLVLFIPDVNFAPGVSKPLDPEPVLKWAEEGFAVAAITSSENSEIEKSLTLALEALVALDEVDVKDKFAVIVYDSSLIYEVSEAVSKDPRIVSFTGYGSFPSTACTIPIILHLTSNAPRPRNPPSEVTTQYSYRTTSTQFVLPQSPTYDPSNASLAHSRTLAFIKKHIGGPFFDLEAIWEEHTLFEFVDRSVEKTMATMVAEPYVNHIPTMTGGVGREALTAFYRDHFIFSNPDDAELQVVSRTVGPDRVIDEFVYHLTHNRAVDWLLPGVPPTGKKLAVPMLAVVNIRGDRLYNEHIWWDQATVLSQAGILPSHLPFPIATGGIGATIPGQTQLLRLPVAGAESAAMLVDETNGKSNEMLGPDWGLQPISQE
ncbi:hypothetical protein JR316_0004561 [Psilocybe cubensis]|uniref:Uncharacterized protein n=2 Tax=Psilocybe cubensis TaxID=181762 RepID=A0ACB8H3P8_PSICU|nr:hypothetical protein JR316_0004561 [Psilocybe cubensis]KAH9482461.1 hypothetical protein JR316_0004561 [Psilocybe cubensis]